jgi:hypothetical protein
MTILVEQRGAKVALFTRVIGPDGIAVDTDVVAWSADEAERFANAMLALLPAVREQETATIVPALQAELKAAQDTVDRVTATLKQLGAPVGVSEPI